MTTCVDTVGRANVDLVSIECSKDGVKFACSGDIGSGSVILKQNPSLDKPGESVTIDMTEPVALTFSLKYLTNFCKASGLSDQVKLCLSSEVPLLVEYGLQEQSYLRFYLAPKVKEIVSMLYNCDANYTHRLVTRTKRTTILLTHERHVFRIDEGNKWRNGFDVRRASNSFMIMACDTGVNGRLQAVLCTLETKGRLPPHHASRVIRTRGISDTEIDST